MQYSSYRKRLSILFFGGNYLGITLTSELLCIQLFKKIQYYRRASNLAGKIIARSK